MEDTEWWQKNDAAVGATVMILLFMITFAGSLRIITKDKLAPGSRYVRRLPASSYTLEYEGKIVASTQITAPSLLHVDTDTELRKRYDKLMVAYKEYKGLLEERQTLAKR